MDKIAKALKKLGTKEKETVKAILVKINCRGFNGLDIKKLKGRQDIYRVRKGKIRIIYRLNTDNKIIILTIERRTDNTYNS
ncbi:type II toxin-antitoxin system RelE/ParE family toxin [Patescibacteria group bacterium]|nr:type II toxin-antitoxin system RelE/ParE family toxin [Patescibacteria group bacterium]MBU2264309.1 type II toxin-antitoxin system RelE/ParE family toxin [Patescibacteria group bacterium]